MNFEEFKARHQAAIDADDPEFQKQKLKEEKEARKWEMTTCIICKQPFKRRRTVSNPKKYCDSPKCQKIKNLPRTTVKFKDMKIPTPDPGYADRKYHGGYHT